MQCTHTSHAGFCLPFERRLLCAPGERVADDRTFVPLDRNIIEFSVQNIYTDSTSTTEHDIMVTNAQKFANLFYFCSMKIMTEFCIAKNAQLLLTMNYTFLACYFLD